MVTHPKSRQASVQFADPSAPSGVQVSTAAFLKECEQSALARFRGRRQGRLACRTIQHLVPPKPGDEGSTGMIVAHVSPEVWSAWETGLPSSLLEKRAHIEAQLHLALEDLADQDMHGYLAITKEQCAIYKPDLTQLMDEALDRTTFSRLGRRSDPNWEGTLVGRVQPPYLVLVVSIGMTKTTTRKAPRRKTTRRPSPRNPS